MADIWKLRKRYERQLNNPHLRKLGDWRMANDDETHDDAAYRKRLEQTASAFCRKMKKVLKDI